MKKEERTSTWDNLQSALAGESMAHVKYKYFAKLARAEGHESIALHFEKTAEQELAHAWGHLDLLVGKPDTKTCLRFAIEGETKEYTEMYPRMEAEALLEGAEWAAQEIRNQIEESKEHADEFTAYLEELDAKAKHRISTAQKRFAALKKVERKHAEAYKEQLKTLEVK